MSPKDLPDGARPAAELIEKLGFTRFEFDHDFPTPRDLNKRVQIRDASHYAPRESVTRYAEQMRNGAKFPPIVVTSDGFTIDGNTRIAAALKNKFPTVKAIVLQDKYDGGTDKTRQRMHLLGAAFNIKNGKGIDKNETRNAIEEVCRDPSYSATRIAILLGVTEATVVAFMAEKRARDRVERVCGRKVNGSMSASQVRRLGRTAEKLPDEPFRLLAQLVQDCGMDPGEITDLIKRLFSAKSEHDQAEMLRVEREVRHEQIGHYKASGKSKPPASAQLRQRLGFIVSHPAAALIEHNPNLVEQHKHLAERAIDTLTAMVRGM